MDMTAEIQWVRLSSLTGPNVRLESLTGPNVRLESLTYMELRRYPRP
jgi:hypothetical protein